MLKLWARYTAALALVVLGVVVLMVRDSQELSLFLGWASISVGSVYLWHTWQARNSIAD